MSQGGANLGTGEDAFVNGVTQLFSGVLPPHMTGQQQQGGEAGQGGVPDIYGNTAQQGSSGPSNAPPAPSGADIMPNITSLPGYSSGYGIAQFGRMTPEQLGLYTGNPVNGSSGPIGASQQKSDAFTRIGGGNKGSHYRS